MPPYQIIIFVGDYEPPHVPVIFHQVLMRMPAHFRIVLLLLGQASTTNLGFISLLVGRKIDMQMDIPSLVIIYLTQNSPTRPNLVLPCLPLNYQERLKRKSNL